MSVFRRDEFVRSVQGQSVPGAQVFVCTQPANVAAYPPTPLATIYSDAAGTVPITQPMITDGFGHCYFYVAVGTYTIVVANNSVIQQTYTDQLIGQTGAGSISLQSNSIANIDQAVLNLKNGNEITVTPDGIGGVVIDCGVTPFNPITAAAGTPSQWPGPRTRGWRGWTPDGASSLTPTYGFGCTPGKSGTATGVPPTATTPVMLNLATTTSASTLAYLDYNANLANSSIVLSSMGLCEQGLQIPTLTTIRVWAGIFGDLEGGANFYKSNTPGESVIGFRYSTLAGDTHWQCVVTDGLTQLTVNSGVAPDTGVHEYAIQYSAPNILFYIDGVQVASISISTTTLTGTSQWTPGFTVDNAGTSNNMSVSVKYGYWDYTV